MYIRVIFCLGNNYFPSFDSEFNCRIGDTSLQEKINAENVTKMLSYIEKYEKKFGTIGNASLYIYQMHSNIKTFIMHKESSLQPINI